jgi:TonB family protein
MPYFMMKFSFVLLLIPFFSYCQTDTTGKSDPTEIIDAIESMPRFPGEGESLWKYVNTNSIYTRQAIDEGIEGTVFVQFWIERDGSISNPKVIRSLSHELDSISLNIVQNMPKWVPATQRDKPVKVAFTLPIKFRLEGRILSKEPVPTSYWGKRGKRKFENICKKIYRKSQMECDCWYKFIVWNYNSLKIEMIDLDVMFEKQKCDNR